MKTNLYIGLCVVFALNLCVPPAANAKEPEDKDRLVDKTFRTPTKAEVERYRELINRRDLEQSLPDLFAYRCEAFILEPERPERFVSIHAMDRQADAVRHVVRRTFTDDDDPRLFFSDADRQGFGSTKRGNVSVFPVNHDRLRVEEKIYLTNDENEALPRDEVRLSTMDRNLDPVTCALLPASNFFRGNLAKKRLSQVYSIEKLELEEISIDGSTLIAKHPVPTSDGSPSGAFMFIKFVDDLPVAYEMWRLFEDGKELMFRTVTQWKAFEEVSFPVRIQALQAQRNSRMVVEMNFQWKFNDQVPGRLFAVSNVSARDATDWD